MTLYHPASTHASPPPSFLTLPSPFPCLSLQRFADPAARDAHKNTPLHLAVRCGHLSMVKYLLTLRAPSSALLPAELLLRSSASHHLPSTTGHAAAVTSTRAALAGLAAQPCAFNDEGDTPLLLAARYGRVRRPRLPLRMTCQLTGTRIPENHLHLCQSHALLLLELSICRVSGGDRQGAAQEGRAGHRREQEGTHGTPRGRPGGTQRGTHSHLTSTLPMHIAHAHCSPPLPLLLTSPLSSLSTRSSACSWTTC